MKKLKPFEITFHISTEVEAKILLTLLEGSPQLFAEVIRDIKEKSNRYSNEKFKTKIDM